MKRKRFLLLLVCLALTCVFLPGCANQEEAAPAITGTVCDAETNEPLSDVTVTLTCTFPEESEGTNPTVTTGTDGSFQLEIPDDATGLTSVFLEKEGYEAVTQELPEGTPAAQDLGTISLQAIEASSKEIITDITEQDWETLERMLEKQFYIAEEYDCTKESATDYALTKLTEGAYWAYFPDEDESSDFYEGRDPRGQFDDFGTYTYYKLDADKCDWIIENIYNTKPDRTLDESLSYYENGFYYFAAGGGGFDAINCTITDKQQLNDGKYYVTCNELMIGAINGWISDVYLVVDLKLIDGEKYWTFYQLSDEPISEYETETDTTKASSADTAAANDDETSHDEKNENSTSANASTDAGYTNLIDYMNALFYADDGCPTVNGKVQHSHGTLFLVELHNGNTAYGVDEYGGVYNVQDYYSYYGGGVELSDITELGRVSEFRSVKDSTETYGMRCNFTISFADGTSLLFTQNKNSGAFTDSNGAVWTTKGQQG